MKPRTIIVDGGRLRANADKPLLDRDPVFYLGKSRVGEPVYADQLPLMCPCCGRAAATVRAERGVVVVIEPFERPA